MSDDHLLGYCGSQLAEMITTIRRMVELESPSSNKAAADRCGAFLARRFAQLGGRVRLHRQRLWGDSIQVEFPGRGKPVMLLGHYDTVWPLGTLKTMPFRQKAGRLFGPGVFDMKSGIAMAMLAIQALRHSGGNTAPPLRVLLNADEETGSEGSRKLTEELAKRSAAVLVLEPAQGLQGAVKTARKGVGDFTIKIYGVAAHAGLDFEKGQNAVVEMAQQIVRVSGFTDLARGVTVSVGFANGGSEATNVVPAEATAKVDVRVPRLKDAAAIEKKFRALRAANPKCKLEISGGITRPPLERTPAVAGLYKKARRAAAELGWELMEASVGGGSDGNFTGALGIPTLDGLGAVGEGAHAPHESVLISELPRRAALLAKLIQSCG
jgi:glutamate carboxypeptidase